MATWQEIGINNFEAARNLYEDGKYRSATSRFYYAAFSVLTHELIRRGATPDFRDKRATPGHAQLARLVGTYFTHLSIARRDNLISSLTGLYGDRIAADYSLLRVDKRGARASYTSAKKIFDYLEVRR